MDNPNAPTPSAPPSYDLAVNTKDPYNQPPQPYSEGYQQAGGYPPQAPYPPQAVPYPAQTAPYPAAQPQAGFQSSQFDSGYAPVATDANPKFGAHPGTFEPSHANTDGFTTGASFDDKAVRRVFIRKVFLVLFLQLMVTFGFICLFFFIDDVKIYVRANPALYWASYGVFIVFYFILVCSTTASRKHPCNLIMLSLLTLALSYMVGTITSFYNIESVLIGVGVTAGVCVTVMVFSIQTKFDFTKCGGLLFVLAMVLFFFGFVTIFTYYRSWYVQVVYGSLGALVFTLFLAFDTQLVMGGRKYELDPEEYVFGALILYIDIVYIFIFLLSIFGGSSN